MPAQAETLKEALAQVYESNPAIQSARATLRATDEGVAQAVSGWRPTLSAQAGTGFAHQEFDTTTGNLKPSDASLTLTQPIYRGGRTVAATAQADATVKQEQAKLIATEQSVLLDAATAYMDVLQNQSLLALYQGNQADMQNWLAETQTRFKLGDKTQTDIDQAQAFLARAQATLNMAAVNLQNARATYLRYVGHMPDILEPATALPALTLSTREAALTQAGHDAPVVQAALYADKAVAKNIDVVKGNLLPEVSLQGQISHTWNENVPQQFISDNQTENDEIMLQVKIPLYTGGADYARLRAAYQDKSAKRHDLNEAMREAQQQAGEAWDQEQATANNIAIRKQQVTAAAATLDGMKKEERVGDRSSTDRLDAEQDLLNARAAAIQAAHDNMIAQFRLRASLGEFTAQKLNLPVTLYDPQKYYLHNRHKWFGAGSSTENK